MTCSKGELFFKGQQVHLHGQKKWLTIKKQLMKHLFYIKFNQTDSAENRVHLEL